MQSATPDDKPSRAKAALLVNMIAPARLPLFSALAKHFDLLLLHGGVEANRGGWRGVEDNLKGAAVIKAWGWQIPVWRRNGEFQDRRYVHFTPGYLWHLFRFRPEVVVTNEIGFRTVAALLYGTLMRKPVWVWWGGTVHTERRTGPARKFVRAAIARWARHWISYGRTSTEYLQSLGIRRNAIVEIQNSADERRFANRVEPTFRLHPRPVLLCVGSLTARKGAVSLLHAAAAQQREGRSFSLLLVGSGPERGKLEMLVRDLALQNVHFQAECPPEELPGIYRSGDILVFPTLEDVWGMVANEAVLSGIPVLCSRYAGCAPELFPEGSIFDPKDPRDFHDKLGAALAGKLHPVDPTRLKSTEVVAGALIRALEGSLRRPLDCRPEGEAARVLKHNAQQAP